MATLKAMGIEVTMLTGDNSLTAQAVATRVGIDHVVAGVRPADKVAEVRRLQSCQRRVAMVGDGINDAAALVQADLGIAMGDGTGVAVEASDITLLSGNLQGVVRALLLAQATYAVILQNLGWAFGYNMIALPLAAVGLLSPVLAALAMGISSTCVVLNSLRLKRFGRSARSLKLRSRWGRTATIAAAWLAPAFLLGSLVATTPSAFLNITRVTDSGGGAQMTVTVGPGIPPVYTLILPDARQIQAYLDPDHVGTINELHVTFTNKG
ncbi:MAG TPA: HAD-IC family P-type ATPase, partial [Actinomycetota bacterium]|nr:HAD-IC family P-type ATPase [Actinomycetota bacterium]